MWLIYLPTSGLLTGGTHHQKERQISGCTCYQMTALSHFKNGMQGVGIANISVQPEDLDERAGLVDKATWLSHRKVPSPKRQFRDLVGKRDLEKGRYAQ